MEAIVLFDPQNFPIFSQYNDVFGSNMANIAFKLNLIENFSNDNGKDVELEDHQINDLISLMFSPSIALIRVLKGKSSFIGNLLSEHVKNTRITHEEFMDHVIVYVSNLETSRYLQRDEQKLCYMLEIIKFIFGSNPSSIKFNESGKCLVSKMYETWLKMRNEPRYLFESTEKLIISPQLRTNFSIILQQVLVTIKGYSLKWKENIVHALVILDGKLVSEFHCKCSRSPIAKKSMIMIQLLLDSVFNQDVDLNEDAFMSCRVDTLLSETLTHQSQRDFVIFTEPVTHTTCSRDQIVPATLRVIPIKNNLCIVLMSESMKQPLAASVSCLLRIFNDVMFQRGNLKGFIDVKSFNQCCQFLHKYYLDTKSKLVGQVVKKLNLITDQEFKRFLVDINHRELPSSMDALLSSTCSSLRTLYHQEIFSSELLRLSMIARDPMTSHHTHLIQKLFFANVCIFIDYVFVKSMRNMTVDPYIHLVPGIVNFVFIDRRNNLLVHSLPPNHDLTKFVMKSRQALVMGNFNYKWTNRHRIYDYFLWFEDFKGNSSAPIANDFTLKSFPSVIGDDFVKEITSKCYPSSHHGLSNCSRTSNPSVFEFFLVRESRTPIGESNDLQPTFLQVKRMSHQLREIVSPELLPHFL